MRSQRSQVPYNPRGIRSQREVGRLLGISQGRVMQIEKKALMKLVARLMADDELREEYEDK